MPFKVQAVIFERSRWDALSARNWLEANNIPRVKHVHTTKNYLRYRVREPKFSHYITKDLDNGIKMVLGAK